MRIEPHRRRTALDDLEPETLRHFGPRRGATPKQIRRGAVVRVCGLYLPNGNPVGTETFNATVTELPEDVGQAKLRAQAELMPQFGEYITSAAPRVIPAFHIAHA